MKKIIMASAMLAMSAGAFAQCGKKNEFTAAQFQMVDSSGNVGRTREADVLIEQSKDSIRLSYNGDPNSVMEGSIRNLVCNWTEPFKVGKTSFSTELMDPQGEAKKASFTIEGVNGKIVILAKLEEDPNRIIRVDVDKYTEK